MTLKSFTKRDILGTILEAIPLSQPIQYSTSIQANCTEKPGETISCLPISNYNIYREKPREAISCLSQTMIFDHINDESL